MSHADAGERRDGGTRLGGGDTAKSSYAPGGKREGATRRHSHRSPRQGGGWGWGGGGEGVQESAPNREGLGAAVTAALSLSPFLPPSLPFSLPSALRVLAYSAHATPHVCIYTHVHKYHVRIHTHVHKHHVHTRAHAHTHTQLSLCWGLRAPRRARRPRRPRGGRAWGGGVAGVARSAARIADNDTNELLE